MKKKIIGLLIIVISFALMYGAISINELNISSAQERILDENYSLKEETITEEIMMEEAVQEETTEQEETNAFNGKEIAIIIISTVIFVMSFFAIVYSTMFIFNGIKFPLTNLTCVVYVLLVLIASEAIIIPTINYADKKFINGERYEKEAIKREKAFYVVKSSKKESNKKYEGLKADETVLKITNESTYEANQIDISKIDGNKSPKNKEYGINDVILIQDASILNLVNSVIKSDVKLSNAISATGLNTRIDLDKIKIITLKENSKAIVATNNSEVSIKDSEITTVGQYSTLFESSSTINVDNIKANTNSNIATIYDANTISINNSKIETNINAEVKGIFEITNSSKTGASDSASLAVENSTIKLLKESPFYKTTPLFSVNNTNAQINITKNRIIYGSNILLSLTALENSSLKSTVFTITESNIKGNILADKNSGGRININRSTYTGAINPTNGSKNIVVTLDKYSTWNLTGDSYIDTITFQNQRNIKKYINSNGYNIYCSVEGNEWLEGKTLALAGGGKLIPINKAS